jgi:hypothetical protein
LDKIIFDQKSLKPHLSQPHLILDALALLGDLTSPELKLAIDSTPNYIDFEQCHLEKGTDGEIR